jgi:choline dehydrogenase-like flavoprotein
MAKFDLNDEGVVVIVGSGAGGGTLGNELAQKGVKVVVLEAGSRHETSDYINDEWASFAQLAWKDMRTTSGSWRVARDFPNLPAWVVKAVGGSTVHWAGASIRFQEHEFRARTTYGEVAGRAAHGLADHARRARALLRPGRAQDGRRRDARHRAPAGQQQLQGDGGRGAQARLQGHHHRQHGHQQRTAGRAHLLPAARLLLPGLQDGRQVVHHYTEIPAGEETGNMEVRRTPWRSDRARRARPRDRRHLRPMRRARCHRQRARVVCVAGNSIESPRLLLNSASSLFPDGMANCSGQVGRNYMRHTTGSVYAIFERPVHMYRGTTMAGIIRDESRHDTRRGFAGGYELETLSIGVPFMAAFLDPGAWGRGFTSAMDAYDRMAGLWIVGEDMPQAGNRITLDGQAKDRFGLPVANVHFDDHPNDAAMREHGYRQGSAIYEAVGATRVMHTAAYPSTHNLGTNRMSANARDGVVDRNGKAHDLPNLYVSDGSQFTTGAACNPTLTIVALAIRQAEHLAGRMARGEV